MTKTPITKDTNGMRVWLAEFTFGDGTTAQAWVTNAAICANATVSFRIVKAI